jgi:SAM-dependent methyltransferase
MIEMGLDRAKSIARRLLPTRVQSAIREARQVRQDLGGVFSRIYANGDWGRKDGRFYSGDGSHDASLVGPYVAATRAYLQQLPRPLRVVDLGCGDFNVGRQLVDLADAYIACDVVPELIERNRADFRMPNVRFDVLNIVSDRLPPGDVVCVRQVFQHLGNVHIASVLRKLPQYPHWIVTEHLPLEPDFTPNLDKPPGRNIRLDAPEAGGSGVVLTAPPFNVRPRQQQTLCEVPSYGGVIRTVAYEFGSR